MQHLSMRAAPLDDVVRLLLTQHADDGGRLQISLYVAGAGFHPEHSLPAGE